MYFYTFLTVALLVQVALSWVIWVRTKNVAFLFGNAVMYYWSLHGAWSIVTDQLGGDSKMHYHYLFDKTFSVYLDEYYVWTLALYAAFIITVQLCVLFWIKPRLRTNNHEPVVLSHDRILVFCCTAAALSIWIIYDSLGVAMSSGASGYVATRSTVDEIKWFSIHQVLNRIALVPAAIGFATLMSSGQSRYLSGARHMRHYLGYAGLLSFMFGYCVVLGNKNELALALFSGCPFYFCNSTKPKTWQLVGIGTILLTGVGFIDYARTFSLDEIASSFSFAELANSLNRLADSNEGFAAHISLYGVMAYELPFTYGSSITSFLASIIPREMWPDRPPEIYQYYADGVGAVYGQGYTIHHAAGWYLNFGVTGVFVGALLLGRLWVGLYNNTLYSPTRQPGSTWRVFQNVCFFTFSASLPTLIRGGPEGYKGVIIEGLLLPVIVLTLSRSSVKRKRVSNNVKSTPTIHPRLATASFHASPTRTLGRR
jgi:hypothetical protein